jgi:hypothetical protein
MNEKEFEVYRKQQAAANPPKKQIVVTQGSWNLIGMVSDTKYGIKIEETAVIRVWGTTKGIGEIALGGPTKDTKLDPCGTVSVPHHAVIMRIDCVFE